MGTGEEEVHACDTGLGVPFAPVSHRTQAGWREGTGTQDGACVALSGVTGTWLGSI